MPGGRGNHPHPIRAELGHVPEGFQRHGRSGRGVRHHHASRKTARQHVPAALAPIRTRGSSRVAKPQGLASCFTFELFSPHMDDMDSSNNSSIVLKLVGLDQNGFSYLITGYTETDRWDSINRYFGKYLASDVMAAPHHGARSGLNAKTLLLVSPNTVLISAGVDNSYGHPYGVAVQAYQEVADHVFCTNVEGGMCLFTRRLGDDFETRLVRHFDPVAAAAP